jgi:hypothetical protein
MENDARAALAGWEAERPTNFYDATPNLARVSGTQIHSSCCSGVFVDESAESVVSVELVWWA